ncbi:hypothetical protein N825_10570 [Skermanella stibiiresistens SB22]|uniref:Glycosyltransferase RgtA/B/C/D-like domain-containing protein n=1 Tax=Skermanella stibiiresistens SB22 TaxID=1385369 RepID=W9GYF3_9PROT|nr:hypothetical protein [Skermanella stibiiresistens]EWY38965.1 hypothetical protein N825_10570 [Skermanella stibiiresistens SB22]
MHGMEGARGASTIDPLTRGLMLWVGLLVAAVGLTLFPLLLVDVPPLLDHPNHVARSHVMATIGTDPNLARYYAVDWKLVPNLGSDLVMAALMPFMSAEAAGNVLIGVILLTTLAGILVLHRVLFGRLGWWPLAGFLLLYHGALTAGFTSFSLGLGVMLLALAQWIAFRESSVTVRLIGGVVSCMILYVTHLMALGFFGILVGGYELARIFARPRGRRFGGVVWMDLAVLCLPFVPPLIFFLRIQLGDANVPEGRLMGTWTLWPRLRGVLMPVLNYNLYLDAVTLLILGGMVSALAWFRRLRVAVPMLPGMAIVSVLFVVLPGTMLDTGFTVERFPIVVALVGVAAIRPEFPRSWIAPATAAVLGVLFVARMTVVAQVWYQHQDYLTEFRAAVQPMERGSRMIVADALGNDMAVFRREALRGSSGHLSLVTVPALVWVPTLVVNERSVFNPMLFSHPQKQVLSVRPEFRHIAPKDQGLEKLDQILAPRPLEEAGRVLVPRFAAFDYLLITYADYLSPEKRRELRSLEPVFESGRFIVMRNQTSEPLAEPLGRVR